LTQIIKRTPEPTGGNKENKSTNTAGFETPSLSDSGEFFAADSTRNFRFEIKLNHCRKPLNRRGASYSNT
jgi:hypothetical protein